MALPPLRPSSINDQVPVPKADGPARRSRLARSRPSSVTVKLGLGLLGIPSFEGPVAGPPDRLASDLGRPPFPLSLSIHQGGLGLFPIQVCSPPHLGCPWQSRRPRLAPFPPLDPSGSQPGGQGLGRGSGLDDGHSEWSELTL